MRYGQRENIVEGWSVSIEQNMHFESRLLSVGSTARAKPMANSFSAFYY
jgi:hypothetical protein